MKKTISVFVCLLISAIIISTLVSCNGATPYSVWDSAIGDLSDAKYVSADFTVKYGDDEIKLNVRHDTENGSRAIAISLKEGQINIASDGTTNYYELSSSSESQENVCYSAKNTDDSRIVKDLLSFVLIDNKSNKLTKDDFSSAEMTENEDGRYTVKVALNGSSFKTAFAPDEDIEFSSVNMTALFSKEKSLESLSITCGVSGNTLYGLPLYNKSANSMEIKVENIDCKTEISGIVPFDTAKYTELPAFSKVSAAALMLSLKEEADISMSADISLKATGMTISIPIEGTVVSAYNNEFLTQRIKFKVNLPPILGTLGEGGDIDIFTDGESNYAYYTFKDGEQNYKEEVSVPDVSDAQDIISSLSIPDIMTSAFGNCSEEKQDGDTVLKLTLTAEAFNKIVSSLNKNGDEQIPNMLNGINVSDIVATVTFGKSGYIKKISLTASNTASEATTEADNPFAGMAIELNAEIKIKDITEDVEPSVPEGYKDYKEQSTEDYGEITA